MPNLLKSLENLLSNSVAFLSVLSINIHKIFINAILNQKFSWYLQCSKSREITALKLPVERIGGDVNGTASHHVSFLTWKS